MSPKNRKDDEQILFAKVWIIFDFVFERHFEFKNKSMRKSEMLIFRSTQIIVAI